jgi:hypothetical protein
MSMNMLPWSILIRTILIFITGTGIDVWVGWYVNRPGLPGVIHATNSLLIDSP